MQLKTHEELIQHEGDEVTFISRGRQQIFGRLFLDTYNGRKRVYILNNRIEGCYPNTDEWKKYGYKYSWNISSEPNPYECDNRDVYKIETISIDFNRLEKVLCI